MREYNGLMIPQEDASRYKPSTINRHIYEKIKKMRQNKNYAHLDREREKQKENEKANE